METGILIHEYVSPGRVSREGEFDTYSLRVMKEKCRIKGTESRGHT